MRTIFLRIIGFLILLGLNCPTFSSTVEIREKSSQDSHPRKLVVAHSEKEYIEADEHDHHNTVAIQKEDLGLFEIELAKVRGGSIQELITIPGEVSLNQDLTTHIVPRISGIVKKVHKNIGEQVKKGDILATLESMDLADTKAQYLSYLELQHVSKEIYELIEDLKKQGIAYTKEYLDSKARYAEARINVNNTKQKLLTYGFSEKDIENINKDIIDDFMRYEVKSPIDGVVLEKHISIGEFVKDDKSTMTIANMDEVWIDFSVFQDELFLVGTGTKIVVTPLNGKEPRTYKVSYAAPIINEITRTGLARVIAPNIDKAWRPGEFTQGTIIKKSKYVDMLIPKSAVQTIKNKRIVFLEDVKHKGTFFPREIVLGEMGDNYFEVRAGLKIGDSIVSKGAFILKAQASKSEIEDGHNH